jgi:hypothetical protein
MTVPLLLLILEALGVLFGWLTIRAGRQSGGKVVIVINSIGFAITLATAFLLQLFRN